MKMNGHPQAPRGKSFLVRAVESDAERILSGPFDVLRQKMLTLFLQGKRSIDIAVAVGTEMPIENDVSDEMRASVVRRVIAVLATPEQREAMTSFKHHRRMLESHDSQDEGRDEWMREQGMQVWTAEEASHFKCLLNDASYMRDELRQTQKQGVRKRRIHYNHVRLAAALNERFQTTTFTPARTRRKLELLRKEEEKTATLELATDELGQLDDTV